MVYMILIRFFVLNNVLKKHYVHFISVHHTGRCLFIPLYKGGFIVVVLLLCVFCVCVCFFFFFGGGGLYWNGFDVCVVVLME